MNTNNGTGGTMGGMGGNKGGMTMKHHMWMWFHTSVNDTVLFDFWTVTTPGGMALSCLLVFTVALAFEALKWVRFVYDQKTMRNRRLTLQSLVSPRTPESPLVKKYKEELFSMEHLIQTVLFGLQVIVSYLLMLVFMTFSVWLALSIVFGTAVGYYFFGSRTPSRYDAPEHQASSPTN